MQDRRQQSNERRERESRRRRRLGQTLTSEGWLFQSELELLRNQNTTELDSLLNELSLNNN